MRWDLESVKKVAVGLSSNELYKKHRGAWNWAYRHGKLREVCPIRQRQWKWDLETVKKAAFGLSREEFKKKYKGAWNWAQRHGKLDEVCPERQLRARYTIREVAEAQRKYDNRSQLCKGNIGLHSWLKHRNLLDGFFPLQYQAKKALDANGEPRHDADMARFMAQCRRSGVPCSITNEDWIRHLNTHNCDVCGSGVSEKTKDGRNKHLDHCHKTGKYRGTLCHQCNVAEGMLKTKENVKKLLDYLMDSCV